MNLRSAIPVIAALFVTLSGCSKSGDQVARPTAASVPSASNNPPIAISGESNSLPAEIEIDVDKSAEHLTQGNVLLNQGKLREAVEQFRLAIKFNPDDEDLYYNLGF